MAVVTKLNIVAILILNLPLMKAMEALACSHPSILNSITQALAAHPQQV